MDDFRPGDFIEYKVAGSLKKFGIYLGRKRLNDDEGPQIFMMVLGQELDFISVSAYESGNVMVAVRSALEDAKG